VQMVELVLGQLQPLTLHVEKLLKRGAKLGRFKCK
jgi:hypothetical protein